MSTSSECWRVLALSALLVAPAALAGCTVGNAPAPASASDAATITSDAPLSGVPPRETSTGTVRPSATTAPSLAAALERAVQAVDGSAAIAVAARAQPPITVGATENPAAWSTGKVPLAMAVLAQRAPAAPVAGPNIRAAITQSSNDAADALWSSLGTPAEAGEAVHRILRAGGDATTVVQTRKVRPEFSALGQTLWPDANAAKFAASLPCSPVGAAIVEPMREVAANQQWGAYGLRGARSVAVKGGWGPDPDGGYLVRQLALVNTDRGATGIMMSVRPRDGALSSGQAALTTMAAAIASVIDQLPTGRC